MSARARRGAAAVALGAVLIGGCGIPVESEPRALPQSVALPTQPAQPAPAPLPAQRIVQLWFVRDGRVVEVDRTSPQAVDSQGLIDLLVAGPTLAESEQGLRTAVVSVVTGRPLVVTAAAAGVATRPLQNGTIALVLEEEFVDLPGEEQLLVLGQVVGTVTVGTVSSVVFVDRSGTQLGVPLPDGRLENGPVDAADYAPLQE